MKKFFYLLLIILLITPALAFAIDMRAGEEIFVHEIINDDAYFAGTVVQVDNDINGDLAIAGARITVVSRISQDLTLAGGDIAISGEVGDDARIGGGNIKINALIKDDLILGGGNVDLARDSFVGGDLIVGAGNLILNGDIQGTVLGGVGNIYINGKIKGNLRLFNVENLGFGPKGQVSGNLSYDGSRKFEIPEGKVLGKVTYSPSTLFGLERLQGELGDMLVFLIAGFHIYMLLSMLFFGLFLLWAYRFFALHASDHAFESPLKDLGMGVVTFIVTPIVGLLFLITFIGIPLGLVTIFLWLIVLYIATLIASLMIGSKLVRIDAKSSFLRMFGSLAVGVFIFVFLGLIPIVGWAIKILITLMALGAMVMYKLELATTLRKKKLV